MSKITVEVSEDLLPEIPLHDQAMVRQIFELGLTQLKIEIALRRYREGGISLGYAARLAGIPKREMILQARARGMMPRFSEQTVREELGTTDAEKTPGGC
jgi:predicted HTH domain antitoxin